MRYTVTEQVRVLFDLAGSEASRSGQDRVGVDHLTLALTRDPEAAEFLASLGATPGAVRGAIERELGLAGAAPSDRPGSTPLPFDLPAKRAIELAAVEARERQEGSVRPTHLVVGVLREGSGTAARLLARRGRGVTESAAEPARPQGKARGDFRIEVDAESGVTIHEQIVAKVVEAVATGVLIEGERLPAVRQLADELSVAPGTVARAYRALEARGCIVADGARGTRVAERHTSAPAPQRPATLTALLRPIAVTAYHLGSSAPELRTALEQAMHGIFDTDNRSP